MFLDVEYNKVLGSSLQIYARERPAIPAARKRRETIVVPGRDGELSLTKNEYEPTEITIPFNYIGKKEDWEERWRKARKWLSPENNILRLSDDEGYFYRISHVELSDNERTTKRIGNFEATFITTDGLSYLNEGLQEYEKEEIKWNPYEVAKPIYKITGEGNCTLTVNGSEMRMNVGQNLVIDTERMIAYRFDGTMKNTTVSGKYEKLYLQEGENEIAISEGFGLRVIPNWRCI